MISRKYNFKNNTFADAEQIDAEFDQIVATINTLLQTDINTQAAAQMKKITNDVGGVTLSLQKDTDDLLASIAGKGQGPTTVYAVAAVKNTPSSNAFRGFAHLTSDGYGWLIGFDSVGDFYTNTINNGAWSGWSENLLNPQTELWTGALVMKGSEKVTPSKPLSKCRNGWILIWSDFDTGKGSNDFDFAYSSNIPKYAANLPGKTNLFDVPNYLSPTATSTIVKRLTVTDTQLTGDDDNNVTATSTNDVCLRAVLEW